MTLETLYKHFAQHKESQWILQQENARLLYDFVKQNPIKRVLDLGCGIGASASIVALALINKGETAVADFHIDSVEQFDKCIKIANELIPPELKEHITIHKSEVVFWQTDKIPYQYFSNFETLPENEYQLILVDDSSPILVDGKYIELPNGDVLKMLLEDKIKAGTIVIFDGRLEALKTLERYFSTNFKLVKPPERRFNVLRRQNNPVCFRDEKLLEMQTRTTYFKDL